MGSCIVEQRSAEYLYYIGWSRGVSVPFYTFIGCAISVDGGETFSRVSNAPIVERDSQDAFLTTSPWVLVEDGLWRMWYASGTGWQATDDRPRHSYHIRYAESDDGIVWRRTGRVCIDYADDDEYAIARPCVVKTDSGYEMWYSCRGAKYRIGYADIGRWPRVDTQGCGRGHRRLGRGMGCRDDRISMRVRARSFAIHALQRQWVRRDRHRDGRARGAVTDRAFGGRTVPEIPSERAASIPFNRPYATGDEFDYIRSGDHELAPLGQRAVHRRCTELLEHELGSCRVLLTHSCTGALEMAMLLSDIGPGDEVIVPSFAFSIARECGRFARREARLR